MSASTRKRAATPNRNGRGGKKQNMEDKEGVEVVARMSPYSGSSPCLSIVSETILRCTAPAGIIQRNGQPYPDKSFEFGCVFDDSDSQKTVFERCSSDLIEHLITGKNALLFTYGVTGSGKTYTMTGNASPQRCGILPRTLDCIFNSIDNLMDKCIFYPNGRNGFLIRDPSEAATARRNEGAAEISEDIDDNRYVERKRVAGYPVDYVCSVFVSYIEIYNNICYDLLDSGDGPPPKREQRVDVNNQVYVEGVREVEVDSANEALALLAQGDARRRVSDTLLNKESSRSHSVFAIRLVMAPCKERSMAPVEDPTSIVVGQFFLVDLAGSERAKRTLNTGERLNEASKINQSLMTLRQCIDKLRRNQRSNIQEAIPYRDSKLTFLFKNFFEGSGKVRMIICVNPRPEDYEENVNVLSFAEESQAVSTSRGVDRLVYESTNRPPVPRRFYTRWNNEVDRLMADLEATRFETIEPPPWEMRGCEDAEAIDNLRLYYAGYQQREEQEANSFSAIMNELDPAVRSALCLADFKAEELDLMKREKDEDAITISSQTAEIKRLRRELVSTKERLSRYEVEDEQLVRVEEEMRRSRNEDRVRIRKHKEKVKQALDFCDGIGRSPSVAQLTSRFEHTEGSTKNRTASTTQISSTSSEMKRNDRDASRDASRVGGPGFYNPKYHRRSKSAPRVIDHQPIHRVPTGGVLRPRFPPNAKHTTTPDARLLQAASDYMLTHQEVDDEGNISTSIVKGECIPTAGGGTAVCFNDVEKLSHESPQKRSTRL